jgi:hypothetical protein
MNPLLWLEWMLTVPGMFVVVPLNSIKTQEDRNKMTWIFVSGFLAVFCLILGNVPISYTINMLFFLAANYLMTWALVYQQYWIWEMHRDAKAELDALGPTKAHSELFQDISNRADVTKNQFYLATYMSISYCVFPLLYYLRMRRDISLEWYTIVTYNVSFLSKYLYSHLVFETHAAVMDNSQYQLLEEKKRVAASKEMLLRFVFHEVRVPLNSLSLGIQFLKATAGQGGEVAKEAATEVLEMMAEGTTFMGETLNDVLSFQKIEDGAMTLEYTWFEPKKLMKAISSTFKYVYLLIYLFISSLYYSDYLIILLLLFIGRN